jgi:hypothetical protein
MADKSIKGRSKLLPQEVKQLVKGIKPKKILKDSMTPKQLEAFNKELKKGKK